MGSIECTPHDQVRGLSTTCHFCETVTSPAAFTFITHAYIRLRNQVKLEVSPEADNRWTRLLTLQPAQSCLKRERTVVSGIFRFGLLQWREHGAMPVLLHRIGHQEDIVYRGEVTGYDHGSPP